MAIPASKILSPQFNVANQFPQAPTFSKLSAEDNQAFAVWYQGFLQALTRQFTQVTTELGGKASVVSITQPLVAPQMTKAQRNALVSPILGYVIFQTDNTPGLRTFNGTNWVRYTETVD